MADLRLALQSALLRLHAAWNAAILPQVAAHTVAALLHDATDPADPATPYRRFHRIFRRAGG